MTPFCCPFTWHKNDKFCSSNILYPSFLSCPLLSLICNPPSRRGLLFDGGRRFLGTFAKSISDYTALFPECNNLHSDSCGSLRSPKRILYRMIKKSLCTCFLYCNHQMHRDYLSPCITDQQIFRDNIWPKWLTILPVGDKPFNRM